MLLWNPYVTTAVHLLTSARHLFSFASQTAEVSNTLFPSLVCLHLLICKHGCVKNIQHRFISFCQPLTTMMSSAKRTIWTCFSFIFNTFGLFYSFPDSFVRKFICPSCFHHSFRTLHFQVLQFSLPFSITIVNVSCS